MDALRQFEKSHPYPWWFFPQEDQTKVQGFLGTGKIFIVGDQPSRDGWPFEHEHRRTYYDALAMEGAGDCHLTDFYKRRGLSGELKKGFDRVRHSDFAEHLKVFNWEVNLLRPSTILAMGRIAERLLNQHTNYNIKYIVHFGVIGYAKEEREKLANRLKFQRSLRIAIREARENTT